MSLSSLLSVIIVTSPAKSNPSTVLIDTVIESLNYLANVEECPIIIVMDGFLLDSVSRTKKGKITTDMKEDYYLYYENLKQRYDSQRFTILFSEKHLGFAHCVKFGLENCRTPFAFILQHDRSFIQRFDYLHEIIDLLEKNDHIRYVGFPTILSMTHSSVVQCQYRLYSLTSANSSIEVPNSRYTLRPLIFWYDSNHLCHVQRYLQIFTPFLSMPEHLKSVLSKKTVKGMVLRNGDFIEDRFGQAQRNLLVSLRENEPILQQVFQWFGSYLLHHRDQKNLKIVTHLRGRHYDPIYYSCSDALQDIINQIEEKHGD